QPAGQHRTRQHYHDKVADREIRRTTDDFLEIGPTDVDLAEADRLLDLGQLGDLRDPTDHERTFHRREPLHLFALEPDPDEPEIEFLRAHRPVGGSPLDGLGQPRLRYSHRMFAL